MDCGLVSSMDLTLLFKKSPTICLLFSLLFSPSGCLLLPSYHLNKFSEKNFKEDCIHTMRPSFSLPQAFTFCYRHKPMITHSSPWSNVFFGNMTKDWDDALIGFDLSIWSYGPWIGARDNGNTVWVSLGTNVDFGLQAWRHTCLVINFEDGKSTLFENGVLQFEDKFEELVNFQDKMTFNPQMISIGCQYGAQQYRNARAQIITDFQLFGRILSHQEMASWTGCEKRLSGNIINWELETWFFNKTELNNSPSEIEMLDFEKDICERSGRSKHIFPIETSVQKAMVLCKKVSGELFM